MKTNTLTINIDDIPDTIWLLSRAVAEGEITVIKQTPGHDNALTIEWSRTK